MALGKEVIQITLNTANEVFELMSEVELYVSAIERDKDNYDVLYATITQIRSKLEHLMTVMPSTCYIIMNYLDSLEERYERR